MSNLPKTNGYLRTELGGDQSDSRTSMPKGLEPKNRKVGSGPELLDFVSWAVDVACTLFLTLHGKESHPTTKPQYHGEIEME